MAPPVAGDGGDGGGGGGGGGGRQQQQQQPGMGQMLTGVIRMAIFWYFASKFFSPKRAPSDPSVQISNLFHKGEPLDMWLYLSEQEKFNDFGSETALFWHETNIPYAVWGHESSRSLSLKYFPSEALKHNGSLYAHVFFARSGYPPDPSDPEYQPLAAFGRTHPVVTYLPKSKADKKKSLLGNTEDSKDESDVPKVVEEDMADSKEDVPVEWVSYWKPNFTISLVDDFTRYTQNAVPPNIAPFLNIEPTTGNYFPTVFFNEFWLLRDKLIPINDTVTELPLHLEVSPISMTKWQLFMQIDQSFQIHRSYGSMLEGESDELKRVFLEGNPYLLGITMVVSLLHSVFDFLAFKNDIQFWNKNKSMEGLSAKSVIVNFICQLIVFLYLLDNETSWMILASSGIGCCIEFWKIGKAMHIEIDRSGKIPMLRFRDRESYAGNKTKEYDDLAMKYLSYLLFFLVVCFSIYSLMYDRHKSWYSWILSSLTSCVYMFGFIMMCPQLFINYKLKSVAHLPWRQMTYKFLNTIIDDLFAFVIKMPTLHRLSVFRDDLIFLMLLYQRWIYPVDKKRVNEFGFGGEDADQASSSTEATIQNEDEKKTN
ncbi:PREDICTED: cleft lip and palate transmembrane protein 1 homolog isoform X1 [Ipomoea nil]|uniref:cleft lip and palate transmembrane protein 1 homolog isoform X1 n=1 Tax=Ipomoea nil TaxID=35883 RepID=UPI000900B450|nr:PREDICTED: cleft lip and palate transmembrane protein 1 homolog isoform X1 [Ipomoea nil]